MVDIALSSIPEPDESTASILETTTLGPVIKGAGSINFNCGECGFRVAEGLFQAAQIQSLVLVCARCKAYLQSRF